MTRRFLPAICMSLLAGLAGCRSGARPAAGAAPAPAAPATEAFPAEAAMASSAASVAVVWPSQTPTGPAPHLVFGEPVYTLHDPDHQIVRRYRAFTVYYDESVLSPRWTAVKLTRQAADLDPGFDRDGQDFFPDEGLRDLGFAVTVHGDYRNAPNQRTWDRGHMVQFDDVRGYGNDAALESFLTTNICPQLAALNRTAWLKLEKLVTEFARDYEVVWVFTGPVYGNDPAPFLAGRKIPRPEGFYKVVVARGNDGGVEAIAFYMPHRETPSTDDLSKRIRSVDEIEVMTRIDFLPDLPDAVEDAVEGTLWELWPDLPGGKGHPGTNP